MLTTLLSKLERVKKTGHGKWMARCPCHSDRSPSLSIRDDNGKILMLCFGCGAKAPEICGAIGFDVSDLFPDTDIDYRQYPQRRGASVGIGADQALLALQQECTVIYMIADSMIKDGKIDQKTKDRLLKACSRVHAVTAFYK